MPCAGRMPPHLGRQRAPSRQTKPHHFRGLRRHTVTRVLTALIVFGVLATPTGARPVGDLAAYQDSGTHLHTLQNELSPGWTAAPPRIVPLEPVVRRDGEVLAVAARPFDEDWDPRVPAGEAERIDALRIVSARGAYASASFMIHAFEDLEGLDVHVALEPTERPPWIEVRRVVSLWAVVDEGQRLARPADAALALGPTTVPAGRTQRYLVTAWIGEDQPAGVYRGHVVVRVGDRTVTTLPLTLEVLDFTLPDPPVTYALWYRPLPERLTADVITRDFALMREHGINSVVLTHANPELHVSRGQVQATFFQLDQIVQAFRKAGLTGPIGLDVRFIAGWASKYAEAVRAAGGDVNQVRTVEGAYEVMPFDDPLTRETFVRIISDLLRFAEERDWPEVFLFAQEEAWGETKLAQLAYFTPLLREAGAKTLLVSNRAIFGSADETELLGDLWDVYAYRGFTAQLLGDARRSNKRLWGYNFRDRLSTGLQAMVLGLEHVSNWAYMWPPLSPYVMLPISSYYYGAFPSLYGHVVSPSLVRMREGIDDTRYLRYLQELGPEGAARAREILERIPLTYDEMQEYLKTHSLGELDALREHIIGSILAIEAGEPLPDLPPALTAVSEAPAFEEKTAVVNGNFGSGTPGGIPTGWNYLQATAAPHRVLLAADAAAGEEGGYGVRFVLNEPGDEIAYLAQRLDVDALRGKKVRVAITFRFRSGGGGSLYARIRQWQGGTFLGDAARVWANAPTGTSLEIMRFSGSEVVAADRGITDFHDVWFTAFAEGVVAEHATSIEIYFGVEKRAGNSLLLDVDSVQVYVLEDSGFSAYPLRRMVSACAAAVPVAVHVPDALSAAENRRFSYRWDVAETWTTVNLHSAGNVLHIPLEHGTPGERTVELRLGDGPIREVKVFVVDARCTN